MEFGFMIIPTYLSVISILMVGSWWF